MEDVVYHVSVEDNILHSERAQGTPAMTASEHRTRPPNGLNLTWLANADCASAGAPIEGAALDSPIMGGWLGSPLREHTARVSAALRSSR